MALKSCPRCFREIPEESKICPHCHTEVRKCPKCETLAIKDTKICSRCGTPMPQSNILIENPEVSANLVVDHVKEFKRKNAFLSILSNQILWSTIAMGLMIVGGILFIFSLNNVNFNTWNRYTTNVMWALIFEFMGYSIKAIPFSVSEGLLPTRLYKYTETTNFDILSHLSNGAAAITKNAKTIFATRKLNFELAKTSEYAKAFPAEYAKYRVINIVRLCTIMLTEFGMVLAMYWFVNYLTRMLEAMTLPSNMWVTPPVIVMYVILAIDLIASIVLMVMQSNFNKARDSWIRAAK